MPEKDSKETIAKQRAAQDMKLTKMFQYHGLGKAGIPKEEGGGIITAFDVIQSFRLRDGNGKMQESLNTAFTRYMEKNVVPIKVAAELGILWGARYGTGEEIAIIETTAVQK